MSGRLVHSGIVGGRDPFRFSTTVAASTSPITFFGFLVLPPVAFRLGMKATGGKTQKTMPLTMATPIAEGVPGAFTLLAWHGAVRREPSAGVAG